MLTQLIRKELHLQKSNALLALGVLACWGLLIACMPIADRDVPGMGHVQIGSLLIAAQLLLIGPCLACVLPLAIGATLVADERQAGVWDWALSLPVSRSRQVALKFAIGLSFSCLLAWGVLPLLDFLFAASIPDTVRDSFDIVLPAMRLSPLYVLAPVLLYTAGAFASSLASHPYKAFFGGAGILAFFLLLVARLADPSAVLLRPWFERPRSVELVTMSAAFSGVYGAAISVLLLAAAWRNFRYDAPRRLRLVGQFALLGFLVVVATTVCLHAAVSPDGMLSNRREDVTPRIDHERAVWGAEPLKEDDWRHITPLLVLRRTPAWWIDTDRMEHALYDGFWPAGVLVPQQGAREVWLPLRTLEGKHLSGMEYEPVRLNIETGERKSAPGLARWCRNLSLDAIDYSPSILPVLDWPFISRRIHRGAIKRQVEHEGIQKAGSIKVGGRSLPLLSRTIFGRTRRGDLVIGKEANVLLLLQCGPDGQFRVRDSLHGTFLPAAAYPKRFGLSPDGRWFSRRPDVYSFGLVKTPDFAMESADGEMVWRIPVSPRTALLASAPLSYPDLCVSHDGRFLAWEKVGTWPEDTHQDFSPQAPHGLAKEGPEAVELGILDLQTGKSKTLWRERTDHLQEGRTLRGSWAALDPRQGLDLRPCVQWAPRCKRLGMLCAGYLTVFEVYDSSASVFHDSAGGESLDPTAPPIMCAQTLRLDLRGFECGWFEFWDNSTILIWGRLGLFRIDIESRGLITGMF